MLGVSPSLKLSVLRRHVHVYIKTTRKASGLSSHLNFHAVDAKWQQRWAEMEKPPSTAGRKPAYVLAMYAYPSGSLHMGHLRVYTISDVIARHRRMKGYDVLHPTGWDSFGLPAENAAIERGVDPAVWTEDNIVKMKKQLISMNTSFNWDAELSTCSPSYYKHTQKLFLMLYRRGLAYQAEALVNYDPVDKTVLANEQVDVNGRSWRSGAIVQQLNLRQWFFRITEFREALLKDLDFLSENSRWPDRVITQQKNWLGQSRGAKIRFDIKDGPPTHRSIQVFTTRPDTLFGVKYLALSMSHPLVLELAQSTPEIRAFLDRKASFPQNSNAGFELPFRAELPVGDRDGKQLVSLFTAPYVLENYGEGAVMGVPAHDSRDLSFWKQHRPSEFIPVVVQPDPAEPKSLRPLGVDLAEAYTKPGVLTSLCGKYAGMQSTQAAENIMRDLEKCNRAAPFETWRLRDWLVSRQRYWGTPIPIINCKDCGPVPVPDEDLPVELPRLDASLQGHRGNALDKIPEWVNCNCPQCHGPAKRETDTMDTFVDSSWYFARFPDAHNERQPFSRDSAASMLPVNTYIGGVEHAILHLLYARFIYKFLCSEGLIPDRSASKEPFQQLIAQGMVHGKTLSDPSTGRFLLPHEVDSSNADQPTVKSTGLSPTITWEKMSKSKHNGVDPSTCITKYGADATRAHILFAAPVSEVLQWDEEKIIGMQRWFGRVQRLLSDLPSPPADSKPLNPLTLPAVDADILLHLNATIKSVSRTIESDIYSLNTAVSDLIKLTNALHDVGVAALSPVTATTALSALLRMLAPIAPAFAEECWERRGEGTIFAASWPEEVMTPSEEQELCARRTTMKCAVQINGKLRFTVDVPAVYPLSEDASTKGGEKGKEEREKEIVDAILASKEGKIWLTERNEWEMGKRVVVVGGGRVVNFVF